MLRISVQSFSSLSLHFSLQVDTAGHKLSQQEQDVDSEVLRVPVAMAMTKLLLALPEEQLHVNLPKLVIALSPDRSAVVGEVERCPDRKIVLIEKVKSVLIEDMS